jgi:branched-chain amino acid transport system substrate-binding protein
MARAARALLAGAIVLLVFAAVAYAQPLTVYSSLPLTGPNRPHALAIVQGSQLALEEAGGHQIRYVSLDDSTARARRWTPFRASANARRAASDESAIAYIGDFNSGASAIAIPILNEAGVAQISPSNQAIGLTRAGPGASPGEPQKYYPSGRRSYFRIAPNDRIQGGALAVAMRDRGCRRVAVLDDAEVYGAGVAAWVLRASRRLGLRVVYRARIDPRSRRFGFVARRARRSRAQCVVFNGITRNGAVPLFRALARGLPQARLFGGDGIAERGFTDVREGGVPPSVARRISVTAYPPAPEGLPGAGRAVLERYATRYGDRFPDPWAVYGYEAMRLVLDTCEKIGPDCSDRQAMIDALFQTKGRQSVLGTYDIDENGDTTLTDYGVYTIKGGELQFDETIQAKGG